MSLKIKLIEHGVEGTVLDDLVRDAASKLASDANNGGLTEQLEFLQSTCGYSEDDIMRLVGDFSSKMTFPDGFKAVYKSEYLEGRRYNELALKSIISAVEPIMAAYNANVTTLKSVAVFELCMSAKYQTLTGTVRGMPDKMADLFPDYDMETFDDGEQERFEHLAISISGALEALMNKPMDYEIKSYGITFDLE